MRNTPLDALDWLGRRAATRCEARMQRGVAQRAKARAAQQHGQLGRLSGGARAVPETRAGGGAELIVFCGDSHNGWAFDLAQDGRAAGVEFGGHAVTSPGYESACWPPIRRIVAAALVAANPELKWCDTSRRGYMAMTLTPDRSAQRLGVRRYGRTRDTPAARSGTPRPCGAARGRLDA